MSDVIEVYTDGASKGNPGPGGYGVVLIKGRHRKELSAGYYQTTNNRMELMAVIVAMKAIKDRTYPICLYSDSKYVVDAINKKWLESWERKGFKKTKNVDLWKQFLQIYPLLTIDFHWIKGHNNHPENERCDRLAVEASLRPTLQDIGYNDAG